MTPASFGVNCPENARRLVSDPPGTGIRNSQLAVCGGLGSKQPYLFCNLDRAPLIPISTGAMLDGAGELSLNKVMGLELVVL